MSINPYLALGVRPVHQLLQRCARCTAASLMLPPGARGSRRGVAAIRQPRSSWDGGAALAGVSSSWTGANRYRHLRQRRRGGVSGTAVGAPSASIQRKMLRLPFTDGMVNRAIIPAKQRFAYDQAVRTVAATSSRSRPALTWKRR